MQHAIAHENESGVVGRLSPLMKIERQRIGALDSREPRREIGRQHGKRAKGAVDVEPELLAARDSGKCS